MTGTSTAYQLSKLAPQLRGIMLESKGVAHPGGSSYGESRMYRQMYSDPYYAGMQVSMKRSFSLTTMPLFHPFPFKLCIGYVPNAGLLQAVPPQQAFGMRHGKSVL